MHQPVRETPKEIAAFGESQFRETGALLVEVLRVKEVTMRKYFTRLRGIAFIVAVVNQDRIRVYFFNAAGVMLGADNIEHSAYEPVRKTSRLLVKYEKPAEPTPEELRMEATEDLRSALSRAIRRVARAIARSEPKFPTVFVTRERLGTSDQAFGMRLEQDGTFVFEESAINASWAEGVALRAGFLLMMDRERALTAFAQCVGNGLAYSLMKDPQRNDWIQVWRKNTKSQDDVRLINHFVTHAECYGEKGFQRILSLVEMAPSVLSLDKWIQGLRIVHDGFQVSLGTDDYHAIRGFCETLRNPRKLNARRHALESIHLAPRSVCNVAALGRALAFARGKEPRDDPSAWLDVHFLDGSGLKRLSLIEGEGEQATSLEYFLNIEDITPKSGGLSSHGKDILRWALDSLGIESSSPFTFEGGIQFQAAKVDTAEEAVLERLAEGGLKILANSLTGSLHRVVSLTESGNLLLLPNFNHTGLRPDFLVVGVADAVRSASRSSCLEATIIMTSERAYGIVSAPGEWGHRLVETAQSLALSIAPIVDTHSIRGLVRQEDMFP
ncbi:MAG: hypothetical protein C4K49_00300, partial [Candidatus Thorarchaeota archaeon]